MCFKFDPLRFIADHAGMALADAIAEAYRQGQQDAQSEHQGTRIFQEIIVEYPSICVYPDYRGRPYFSIKYTENGQEFIGYGTYKPEVLSEYLKEYFMPSAQPEQRWIPVTERLPDTDNEVLVTVLDMEDDYVEVYKGFYQDHEWWTQWCHGCLRIKDEPCGANIVTAWMPLPKPWKEGEAE